MPLRPLRPREEVIGKTMELLTVQQASRWATEYLRRNVTPSNISYLIQYGRIKKIAKSGVVVIDKNDLLNYYQSYIGRRETDWVTRFGKDLNWILSFDHLKESERTKHVHRLHPYKGKFIPQLVEYFLDDHIDDFKKQVYFHKSDIVLDPFCGSGTTLVQASELGIHAIGIDVSSFNALITNVKIAQYSLVELHNEVREITLSLREFICDSKTEQFNGELKEALANFNNRYFPSPEFKIKVRSGQINEDEYGSAKVREFVPIYQALIVQYSIDPKQASSDTFLDKWYIKQVRREIEYVRSLILQVQDIRIRNALIIILSRTARSCRATTHFDLATLKEPVFSPYYCHKHGKVCKPLFSISDWWERYSEDTIQRLAQFEKLKTNTNQICLTGDSRTIDIVAELENHQSPLAQLVKREKIKGIFSSPPYVGLIDYHDQHAYAYDLFHFGRKDESEIGKLSQGQGAEARQAYIQAISDVINNCRRFLAQDSDIFLVANDKYNLYPIIAHKSHLHIVNRYRRPVLDRTERDKGAYSETIFHMKAV